LATFESGISFPEKMMKEPQHSHSTAVLDSTPEDQYKSGSHETSDSIPHIQNVPGVFRITESDKQEAIEFLAERPVHTVVLGGLIQQNGIDSPRNQGHFYSYREASGKIEGIALIGRAVILEARSTDALISFAMLAREHASPHIVFSETNQLAKFWRFYRQPAQQPRLLCNEILYLYREPSEPQMPVENLQVGTIDNLEHIVQAHAELVLEETCISPLETDPEGFRSRCAQRIKGGTVWVLIKDGELIFKADIAAETKSAMYIEGVWVSPKWRRHGYGRRCLEQLRQLLSDRTEALCGFVNRQNQVAIAFYEKSGCTLLSGYDKLYL
jgi:GNAT superfamily N-acetyltransferase